MNNVLKSPHNASPVTFPDDLLPGGNATASSAIRLVGHDLKNKLGVMGNSVYYLNMKVGGQSDKLSRHLAILSREIEISNRTITNLMDYVAPKEPSPSAINLNMLLQGVATAGMAASEGDLICQLAPDLPLAWIDVQQVQRALENILVYVAMSLRAGDTLRIVTRGEEQAIVELIDNGPGLAPDDLDHLFDPRSSGGASSIRLALPVARRLLELNGGTWETESRLGMGTRFSVTLPLDTTP